MSASGSGFIAILIGALAVIGGLVAVRVGRRGVRVGDHPHCRRCGFDLFARPSDSVVCPECVADLSPPDAIALGRHERKRRTLYTGGALVVLGVAWIGIFASSGWQSVNLNPYKPVWWLVREASSTSPATSGPAMIELQARLKAGRLNDVDVRSLVEKALTIQADANRSWPAAWGDLVEAARLSGHVTDEQWRQYATTGVGLSLVTRADVVRGGPLPVIFTAGPYRVGQNSRLVWQQQDRDQRYTVSGQAIPPPRPDDTSGASSSLGGGTGSRPFHDAVNLTPIVNALADGPQTVRLDAAINVLDGWNGPVIATIRASADAKWTLHPAGTQLFEHVRDPSFAAPIRAAISVKDVRIQPGGRVSYSLVIDGALPIDVAFKAMARVDGKNFQAGSIARASRQGNWSFGSSFGNFPPSEVPKQFDLTLKTDESAAGGTIDVKRIWEGEIVLKDIPVPTSPTTAPIRP